MNDGMIRVPFRRRGEAASHEKVIKVSPEAYNFLVDVYNKSALSIKEIASMIILDSKNRIVYDKED